MRTAIEVLFILLLVSLNGLFAMSEIAIVSARKARLNHWADEGRPGARAALDLARKPNQFLSTVQVGITLVGIFSGAFGGATLAEPLGEWLAAVPVIGSYSEVVSFGLVVLLITYLSLVIGELAPKRIALTHPERIATWLAPTMSRLSRLAFPIVFVLSRSTAWILRLLRIRPSDEPPVTEEEFKLLLAEGAEAGVFEEAEQEMLARILRLDDLPVSTLMTPRRKIRWLNTEAPLDESRALLREVPHARLIVCEGRLDDLLGVIQVQDLLSQCLADQPLDLTNALRQPLLVPETLPALRLLERFKYSGMHLALVLDEFGTIQGLVTLNDVMEVIVGDELLEAERGEPQIIRREDGTWLLDGLLPIERVWDLLGVAPLEHPAGRYETLGGFVVAQLNRVPQSADHFTRGNLYFEVVDMDGRRVDKVLVGLSRDGSST